MRELKFEYYALRADFNNKKVEQFNIFDNYYVYNETLKAVVKYMAGAIKYDEYVKEIRSTIMHEMWSRCQYEMAMGDMFVDSMDKLHKVDVFTQVEKNIPVIAMYVYMTAKDYFYNEDVMNTENAAEAIRTRVYIDELKEQVFWSKKAAMDAIDEVDIDETSCFSKDDYAFRYIREYIPTWQDK